MKINIIVFSVTLGLFFMISRTLYQISEQNAAMARLRVKNCEGSISDKKKNVCYFVKGINK